MRATGHLYEAGSSARIQASLIRYGKHYRLIDVVGLPDSDVRIRHISQRLSGVPQLIVFEDGRRFVLLEEAPQGLFDNAETSRWIDALERVSGVRLIVVAMIAILGVAAIRAAVPPAADFAVSLIPRGMEAGIGRKTLERLDGALFQESKLTAVRKRQIRLAAQALAAQSDFEPVPEILFRASRHIGPNALALPGGPVLLTDALVDLLGDDEILAVIAHEFGHIEERHGLRQLVRASLLLLAVTTVFGGNDSLVEELAAAGVSLATLDYSRSFEREADQYAAGMLDRAGRSPGDLADALRKFADVCGQACRETHWFSTHPAIADRIEALMPRQAEPSR